MLARKPREMLCVQYFSSDRPKILKRLMVNVSWNAILLKLQIYRILKLSNIHKLTKSLQAAFFYAHFCFWLVHTVEPRYFELVYFELPLISNWAISPLFHIRYIYIYIFLTSGVKLHIHFLNMVVQFIVFLTLSTLICRGTDISKCFSESLGIRDNESRLYLVKDTWIFGYGIFDKCRYAISSYKRREEPWNHSRAGYCWKWGQ